MNAQEHHQYLFCKISEMEEGFTPGMLTHILHYMANWQREMAAALEQKPMKNLNEHNAAALQALKKDPTEPAGVACPVCETEMVYPRWGTILPSIHPKRHVECPKCQYQGTKIEA